MSNFLILGCGYTGERVARRLLDRGERVHASTREPARLEHLAARGAVTANLDLAKPGSREELRRLAVDLAPALRVLCSIPTLESGVGVALEELPAILDPAPVRMVYLSTTAVYGETSEVNEHTPAHATEEEGRRRLETERALARGSWSTLVLRPAAIYGPHRGLHVLLRQGTSGRIRDPGRLVSRVHVDDLAALVDSALSSEVTGAFPVADDEPATTREVAAFCEGLGFPGLANGPPPLGPAMGFRGRRVDGRAIRRLLGIELRYPSYRSGIPAAVEDEKLAPRDPRA